MTHCGLIYAYFLPGFVAPVYLTSYALCDHPCRTFLCCLQRRSPRRHTGFVLYEDFSDQQLQYVLGLSNVALLAYLGYQVIMRSGDSRKWRIISGIGSFGYLTQAIAFACSISRTLTGAFYYSQISVWTNHLRS